MIVAQPLTAVAIESLTGDAGYLETLPGVHHVEALVVGGVVVWLEDQPGRPPTLDEVRPARAPDVELHGQGAPAGALVEHPRAEHVELFFDGLGDPEYAPRGWWHARVWLKAA